MPARPDLDVIAATDVVARFSSALFEKNNLAGAMALMTPGYRLEWANDWVAGELEFGGERLTWSERQAVAEALADMDRTHRLWSPFATETWATWTDMWASVPDALHGGVETVIHLSWHLTMKQIRALGGQWVASPPRRTGPVRVHVDFELIDSVLYIADINIDC